MLNPKGSHQKFRPVPRQRVGPKQKVRGSSTPPLKSEKKRAQQGAERTKLPNLDQKSRACERDLPTERKTALEKSMAKAKGLRGKVPNREDTKNGEKVSGIPRNEERGEL